jgi:hypothetical protein
MTDDQHAKIETHVRLHVSSLLTKHAKTETIIRYFSFAHLPSDLAAVSYWFAEVAVRVMTLPRSAERTVALRKLLEAKDAAVRAALDPKDPNHG